MRRRRPPFTLVLSTLVAAAAVAITLAGRGSPHQPSTSPPPTVGLGSTRACVTTSAAAQSDVRSAIVIRATAEAPVRVTERAGGPNGIATVTRVEVVTARITANAPVEVKRTAAARARVCANGSSTTAARTTALQAAYRRALLAARALAAKQAARTLTQLIHREYPAVAAQAKAEAAVNAHQRALIATTSLTAQAQAEARRRAGV